jgi:nuclear pore complex protein Nup107
MIRTQLRYVQREARFDMLPGTAVAPPDILDDSADASAVAHPRVRCDFIGTDVSEHEEMLISSFEWYLHVEGHWAETFAVGTALFVRFFRKLGAPFSFLPYFFFKTLLRMLVWLCN